MDGIKEIFEALSQRIKSPFYGYIAFAFTAVNWKSIFYVLFSGKPIDEKFKFVDDNTSAASFLLPLLIGIVVALAAPWVSLAGTWWAENPTNKRRMRVAKAAYEVQKLRNSFREEEGKEVDALIKATQQDAEVAKIENDHLRTTLEKQIKELENQRLDMVHRPSTLENLQKKLEIVKDQKKHAIQLGDGGAVDEFNQTIASILESMARYDFQN